MTHLPRLVSTLGGIFVLVAAVRSLLLLQGGGTLLEVVIDFVLLSFPGVALVYVGSWMPQSGIARRHYSRIVGWLGGGIGVMFGFIALRDLHPGVSVQWTPGTQAIALAIGSIGGLLIGIQEAQAITRTEQLEQRNQELADRERELERQNDRLEYFTSIVSHDLRNPLSVAIGRIELAQEECESQNLNAAADALERMSDLIENTLQLARHGQTVSEFESISLSDVATECWEMVASPDATLEVVTDTTLRADPDRGKHVFENLFRNAIEHAGDGVTIRVGALDDGFYVEDDGPGVPAEDPTDLFESGYTTSEEGTGFGLTIVKEIVEAHDWTIEVTESDDGGARFEITDSGTI